MALSITILVTDGEKVIAQAASELTKELHLKDFFEKTIPGFEETAKAFLDKEVKSIETGFEDVGHWADPEAYKDLPQHPKK